jgi:hypothetical protein
MKIIQEMIAIYVEMTRGSFDRFKLKFNQNNSANWESEYGSFWKVNESYRNTNKIFGV